MSAFIKDFKKQELRVTFVKLWLSSDVGLYVSVTRQEVSIDAALGFPCWRGGGQHAGGRVLRWPLASLEPAVNQGHKEQHHAPNHRRDPRQGESYCVIAKEIMKNTCEVESEEDMSVILPFVYFTRHPVNFTLFFTCSRNFWPEIFKQLSSVLCCLFI